MDSSRIATTSAAASSHVFSKVALLDIPEQHTMESGGFEKFYKEGEVYEHESIDPEKALCILREDMEDLTVLYKNKNFTEDSSSVEAGAESELTSYSYSVTQISEESELRILYFTRPNRPEFRDTPLFKIWRWVRVAFCMSKGRRRSSSDSNQPQ